VQRREESLRLMREELRLFQDDMRITQSSILKRHHHSSFAKAMPGLRKETQVANAIDDVATATFGAGILSLAGATAAAYAFGAAAVFPVIAPVVPFIGGAVVVAGMISWFQDAEGRKSGEIKHKREHFESEIRRQLTDAQRNFETQLAEIATGFRDTAAIVLEPMLLEADAAERLARTQKASAKRIVEQSQASLVTLLGRLEALPNG
jgi:hypothetical protein